MADTSLFEVARQTHEETERYQQALVDIFVQSTTSSAPITHKDKLVRSHKASHLLDRILSRYAFLDDFYTDTSGDKAREFHHLDGSNATAESSTSAAAASTPHGDAFSEFYSRLDKIKEYHQKYPGAVPDAFAVDFGALEGGAHGGISSAAASEMSASGLDFVDRMFSGEEMAGRYMDLYLHHEAFLNLKRVKRVTYLRYIDEFDKLAGEDSKVPDEAKRSDGYKKYLADLRSYLSNFLRKTQPLSDIDQLEASTLAAFDEQWEAAKVEGWEDHGDAIFNAGTKGQGKGKSNGNAATAENGEGIGCEACRRSYSKQTVYDAHLKSPKHQKAAQRLAAAGSETKDGDNRGTPTAAGANTGEIERIKRQTRAKALAREEALVRALGVELASVRADTRANVERRAALTDRERQAEAEAAEDDLNNMAAATGGNGVLDGEANGDEDEDGEEKIYNPLRLPLGWDGRPIPYWLYKLHGLGVEFRCEICSDHVYQGRKNFEKHFQESRHAFGMRALGLPNTVQFRDVTRIQDALALADKVKKQGKQLTEQDDDAEVEDDHGNTYTRKTYELLKRQGLI